MERGDLSGIHWPQVTMVWWLPTKFSRESPDLVTSTGVLSGPLTYNGGLALGGAHLGPESVVVVSEYIVKDFNKFQVYSSPFLPYPRLRDSPPVVIYCNCHEFLTCWTRNGKPSKLGHGWTGPHQHQWSTIKSFGSHPPRTPMGPSLVLMKNIYKNCELPIYDPHDFSDPNL